MDVLYLSHCVPNPPDKGEKIRSFHQIQYLARQHRVHLVCFGRDDDEVKPARELASVCASVYVEKLRPAEALVRGAWALLRGGCLNAGYFRSDDMSRYVRNFLTKQPVDVTIAYTAVMLPYAPSNVPVMLDMVDVDSQKWFDYGRQRRPRSLYMFEARRLREFERQCAATAMSTLLTTANEERLLQTFAPGCRSSYIENGVDSEYFDGVVREAPADVAGKPFIAFVGTMDYNPNIEGALWFARNIFPSVRQRDPDLRFLIIGRNPSSAVLKLTGKNGIVVTGAVPDIRPYISNARAIVAPLHLARGIQNKVLEALAMGRAVIVTEAVSQTFGRELPTGVIACATDQDLIKAVGRECSTPPTYSAIIRQSACERFSWNRNLKQFEEIMMGVPADARSFSGAITSR